MARQPSKIKEPFAEQGTKRILWHRAEIELGEAKRLVIQVRRSLPEDKYISSVVFNGMPYNKVWFSHAEIANGAEIIFNMASQPNKQLGTDPASSPPSLISWEK